MKNRVLFGLTLVIALGAMFSNGMIQAQVATTTVQGTVYRADGTPAQGTMLVSWPAFVTANNQAVAAGSTNFTLGPDGLATFNLAPNAGASPAGTYYTVVYHLSDGTVSREYWTVPVAASATIASVRAQLMPSTEAVQAVTKSYVDNLVGSLVPTAQNFLPLTGGALSGPLILSSDPASSSQASTKHYVDTQVATALPLTGGVVSGTLSVANSITKLPLVNVQDQDFAGGADPTGKVDSTAAFQAAIAFAIAASPTSDAAMPEVYIPAGHYLINGSLRIPNSLKLTGDNKASVVLTQTNATASLITVVSAGSCKTYVCYGAIENLSLSGSGKNTIGTLLEMDTGYVNLRNLQFYNNGGRGLQTNGGTERISGDNLSFYQVRWPMVLGGDTNESYFYNTHVLEAGQTADTSSSQPLVYHYCYSVNCTNGVFKQVGTTASPTPLYPDPHGAIDIDKSVNVSFIGGSIKASYMLSGVKVWAGTVIRFQNFYHEASYYSGQVPSVNHAYIVGGSGEQTYLTGVLSGSGTTVTVNDPSWMPQFFGQASDLTINDGDTYPYVIMPQDYNRASNAPSAYVTGLNQNQYEVVNAEGFTPDGVFHIQSGGRNIGGTAPAGTQWPAGSVVEEYYLGNANVELDSVHINLIQGPSTGNGWTMSCDPTNVHACGEILVGYSPDIQNPTASPATNQVGVYTQTFDSSDPVPGAMGHLTMQHMDMFNDASNAYVGMIVGEHQADVVIDGPMDAQRVESVTATIPSNGTQQVNIGGATGGSELVAPIYANGSVAPVHLAINGGEEVWDSWRGVFHKHTSQYGPNQQFGSWLSGLQYQNLYCLFDTPNADGGHIQNRFCNGGGPSNTGSAGTGYGGGVEYDSWNGSNWIDLFKVWGANGSGSLNAAVPASFGSTLSVTGAASLAGTLNTAGAATFGSALKVSGAASFAGAMTASQVNGAITVDGTTYKTLNQAWTAAVAAATSSGKDQTIWLGPGAYPVSATMTEPTNGACVSVIGSSGTTTGADVGSTSTTLTVPSSLGGDVFYLGNAVLTEGCTFKDLNILASKNATHGFEFQWARGLLLDTVGVNDTTAEGILLGEESTTNGHQAGSLLRNVTVSYSSSAFTPASRPPWGIHLQETAIDSVLHTITVRNAQTAAVWNEGTGNVGFDVHGFGYPYTCTTAPCSNTASSASAANASYASSYVIYDTGGAGTVWSETYADSPAIAGFYIAANGVEVHGGHIQWPDLTSFPSANLAYVSSGVTNNLSIADVSCLGMSSSTNWITYASASGVPPTFTSVHHLTGCGNYYQALEPATTTGFSGGGASNNAPGNGAVAAVWAAPKAPAATYSAFSAQEYNGYQGDLFDGHIAGVMPFFNVTYQGTIRTQGGIALSTVLNTAPALTLTTANKNVIANAASGAQILTLPSCYTPMADRVTPTGLELTILKSDTSSNAVTVQTVSSQTINYQGSVAQTLVLGSAGKRTLVCGPDYNWYAF